MSRAGVPAILRTTRFWPVALGGAAGLAPLLLLPVRDLPGAMVLASVLTAAGTGYLFDEAAATLVDPVPVTLATRAGVRVTGGLVLLTTVLAAQGTALSWRVHDDSVPWSDWWGLTAGLVAVTAAVGATVRRHRPDRVGPAAGLVAATAVVLTMLQWQTTAMLQIRPPLGLVPGFDAVGRWWWIAAAGAVVAGYQVRDLAARGWHRIGTGGTR